MRGYAHFASRCVYYTRESKRSSSFLLTRVVPLGSPTSFHVRRSVLRLAPPNLSGFTAGERTTEMPHIGMPELLILLLLVLVLFGVVPHAERS
jgi:hypothetical protein